MINFHKAYILIDTVESILQNKLTCDRCLCLNRLLIAVIYETVTIFNMPECFFTNICIISVDKAYILLHNLNSIFGNKLKSDKSKF